MILLWWRVGRILVWEVREAEDGILERETALLRVCIYLESPVEDILEGRDRASSSDRWVLSRSKTNPLGMWDEGM